MPRNLLPRLRQAPNPANIPLGKVSHWTTVNSPADLGKLHFGALPEDDIRTRVQSIPNPWARMLLFRVAMDDPSHPARRLVESELLDALQFLWSASERPNATPSYVNINVDDIASCARAIGSERAEWFSNALLALVPQRDQRPNERAFETLTVVLVDGRPIIATSPFTMLFTSEDAAQLPNNQTGAFFRYANGGQFRSLADRPFAFQRYVAQVLLSQLDFAHAGPSAGVDATVLQRLIKKWLTDEVKRCSNTVQDAEQKAQLTMPENRDWRAAAGNLRLSEDARFGGIVRLFQQKEGSHMRSSHWLLRSERSKDNPNPPLIIDSRQFDGSYYPGAANQTLGPSIKSSNRTILPGTATTYPWVSPVDDWFSDQILVLANPLVSASVLGFRNFRSQYVGAQSLYKVPQIALPLRREVLKYLSPTEIDQRLTIEVAPGGQIDVTMRVPVGPAGRDIEVRKRYDEASIFQRVPGPDIALWPRFSSDSWKDYIVFRKDQSEQVAQFVAMQPVADGEVLEGESEQRNALVRVTGADRAPEALEFTSKIAGAEGARLGLILPLFEPVAPASAKTMNVGIDFGTSNSVVSVRVANNAAPYVLKIDNLTLPITSSSDDTRALLDAYFFPHRLKPEPFGTAVVRHHRLPTLSIFQQKIGVRVNVPFAGHVQPDASNHVVGDIKWSSDRESQFLSVSFLRHLVAVVLAEFTKDGIKPENVHITWSYPRAFTTTQRANLDSLWRQVKEYFEERVGNIAIGRDESDAVLHHFFNAGGVTVAGEVNVIVDLGGGTSDIAMYGRGYELALDSIVFGGRNLTGQRLQAATTDLLRNPFVQRFVEWSQANGLSEFPLEQDAVKKYMADHQYHLAFSYVLRSRWFARHGQAFTGNPACHAFQGMVFYFFGVMMYYVGLSLRGIAASERAAGLRRRYIPAVVTLAGNGSKYLNWLKDLAGHLPGAERAFLDGMSDLLVAGMALATDSDDPAAPAIERPRIVISDQPKLEVAFGLVAHQAVALDRSRTMKFPVIGERIAAVVRESPDIKTFDVTSRVTSVDSIMSQSVASVSWQAGEMEIERFHTAYLHVLRSLDNVGQQWQSTTKRTADLFTQLTRRELQQETRSRLEYVARQNEGFSGSLFILEATLVLDRMLDQWFKNP